MDDGTHCVLTTSLREHKLKRDKKEGNKEKKIRSFPHCLLSVSSESSCETIELKMSMIYNLCTGPNTFSYRMFFTYSHINT